MGLSTGGRGLPRATEFAIELFHQTDRALLSHICYHTNNGFALFLGLTPNLTPQTKKIKSLMWLFYIWLLPSCLYSISFYCISACNNEICITENVYVV